MIRASKLIRLSTTLANSLSLTRQPGLNSVNSTQVTHFSHFTQFPHTNKLKNCYNPLNFHKNVFFSTKTESLIDMLITQDWSDELVKELDELNPKLTHDYVVYVLMKLNKDPTKSLHFFKWVSAKKGFSPSYVPFSLLLRCLACEEHIKDFWVVACEMREKGVYVNKNMQLTIDMCLKNNKLSEDAKKWSEFCRNANEMDVRKDVAKNVVDLMLEWDWSEEVEGKLNRLIKFKLSNDFLLRVLEELWRQPMRALRFFDWVSGRGGFRHDSITYNAMAKVLGQAESMSEFWEFVKRMKGEGFEVDIDTYVKISRRPLLPIKEAVELFEFMMDGPYKPSEMSCTFLLRNISLDFDPDIDLVNRVVSKFVAAGNTLSKSVYDAIHRSLCKAGRFDEAKKIVDDLRKAGYEPDNITYSQEVYGLCKLRRFDEAWKLLDQMVAEGCVPDVKTWTILIQGYCTANQVDDALSCFAKMMEKNVDPDAETLEVLINGFLSENKVFGAYRFLAEMVSKGRMKPWQATYKLMIEKLAELGKTEDALKLVKMMKHQGYPPFLDPMIRFISKSGTMDDANSFIKVLTEKDLISIPAHITIIKSFFEEGRHSEAKDLFFSSPRPVRRRKAIQKLFGVDEASASKQMSYLL